MTAEAPRPSGKLKIIADRSACCGYGTCNEICPEIYQLEGGLVVLTTDIVPEGLEEKAIEAAESCPQMALTVEPIDG